MTMPNRRDGGVRHGSAEGCRRGAVAIRVADGGGTPPAVAREAAQALGKIRTPAARTALAQYLSRRCGRPLPRRSSVRPCSHRPIHHARRPGADLVDDRRRRRGALARGVGALPAARSGRGPAAFELSLDPSAEVRFWALRGLAPALVTEAGVDLRENVGAAARRRPRSGSPRPDRGAARARAVRR